MKIGIVVYSKTGNTLSVAERVRDGLATAGHEASIERLVPLGVDDPNERTVELKALPDIGGYDGLVFASPVRGFNVSPAMTACLTKVPSLAAKKIACFVTEQFPLPWMGGNSAIAKMKTLCQAKQGPISGSWIVNWSSGRRPGQIDDLVAGVAKLF